MRYTRNRQMTKIGEENFMGMKNIRISTIRKFDGKFDNRLDPTFKWHRDFVWEIDKYWESYITVGTYGQSDFKVVQIK